MSLTMQTWAQHFMAVVDGEAPKNTVPIWNAFMAQLADALNKPKVDDELRQQGRANVHFNITPEQLELLQEEGGVSRIADGLGLSEEQRSKINIGVVFYGLDGDPRGPCVEVSIWRTGNGPKQPSPAPVPAALGPERELEPAADIPDCDTRLCENVQSVCLHATMRKDCPVADWFLGKAYIHKYTACEADFRKALETDPEFVAFLARQLSREEYGPATMRKMRPVEGECIYELHTLISEKVPEWPFGGLSISLVSCPSTPTEANPEATPAAVQAPDRSASPPPWPWPFRSTSVPESGT